MVQMYKESSLCIPWNEITPIFLDVVAIFGLALVWTSVQLSGSQCVLEKEYFCSSIPNASVTSLALANSGITKIERGAFSAFQSLTKLNLFQNSLTHVTASWLSNPGSLENLTVAQNLIAQIGPNMFSGLSNLHTLNLANNRIRDVAGGSFKDLPKLKFIDLSGNHLTALRRTAFQGLTILPAMKLGSNPWNCSCELQDFGLFLQEMINASLLEDAPSVVCHTPPSLQGVHVWNVSDFNCSPDLLSSNLENGFHKVGLPALLAFLVFISFLVLLFWIWMVKHDNKQVRPSKEIVDSDTSTESNSQADSVAECQQTNKKFIDSEIATASRSMMPKVRAKSASAILLRTEFYQRRQQTDTKWDHPSTTPYVSLNDKMYIGSEDLQNFIEVQNYQKLEESSREEFQSHYNISSFLTEVCIETPGIKVDAEAAKPILQGNGFSGPEDADMKGSNGAENPEPFLYLSIATAPKEQVDVNPPKGRIPKPDGNHSVSLKRTLTWPYERKIWDQRSNVLSISGSFRAQLFMLSPHLSEALEPGKTEGDKEWLHSHPWKEHDNGKYEFKPEAKVQLPKGEAVEETTDGRKSDSEESQRTYGHNCPTRDGQIDHGESELNTQPKPRNQTEFLVEKESKVAVVRGFAHSSQSRVKATKYPANLRNKQLPKPVSSQSRVRHTIHPSPGSSVDAVTTSSSYDDAVSLENNECNYMNLLHEVVENRGRWTRERWKQNRRMRSVHQSVIKSK
ncbi:hypothetical protein JD844_004883 [Phrynosoma platyrhinos]|uniref:LRRCT domain-containing protein n=1 Tax=Phrynosoma platyrhinos TaxID=52577 RepID=A0ABQ7SDY0_PHRPL|nr:hypothetical protein JD844_004883 [Phrynosoma platyrhinos]